MSTEYCTIECWICIDESGDYAVGNSSEDVETVFDDSIGGSQGRRKVKINVRLPLPKPLEASVEVPENSFEVAAEVA